jgi:predicted RNA-binding protein with RPS1 domain
MKYRPGMVVEGVVVRTADFGAFIRLDDYFEGLAHISELVDNKISHAKEVFSPGDKVDVLIMNIDRKSKRIKLSVRRAAEAQRRAEVDAFMRSQGDLDNVFAARLEEAVRESEIELSEKAEVEEKAKEEAAATAVTEAPTEAPVQAEPEEKPSEDEEPLVEEPVIGADIGGPEAEVEVEEESGQEAEEASEEESENEAEILDPSRDGTPI